MDSALNYYGAVAFERLLDDYSTTTVAAILGNEKAQQLGSPEQASHSYGDKYVLAEKLTNCISAAALNNLMEIGMTPPILEQLVNFPVNRQLLSAWMQRTAASLLRNKTEARKIPNKSKQKYHKAFLEGKSRQKWSPRSRNTSMSIQ